MLLYTKYGCIIVNCCHDVYIPCVHKYNVHDGADLSFGPAELSWTSTSPMTPPACHVDGSTATQSLRTFVGICCDHVADGAFVGVGAEVSRRVVETVDAMHRSALSGLPHRIDATLDEQRGRL